MSSVSKELLERIISNQEITILFQPIFNSSKQDVLGYETLARGPINCVLNLPQSLFELAGQLGRLSELELICRKLRQRYD